MVLKWPQLRQPEGFDDIFPVVLAYVIIVGVFAEILDMPILRYFIVVSSLFIFSWVVWAMFQILEPEEENEEPDR